MSPVDAGTHPLSGAQAVLFDAGGVLIGPDWEAMASLVRAGGGTAEADPCRAREPGVFASLDTGSAGSDASRWRAFVLGVLTGGGAEPGPEGWDALLDRLSAYHRTHHLWTALAPDAAEALERLRAAGYRLGVVSNSNGHVERVLGLVGVRGYFEVVIDSHHFGVEKPDPRIFLAGCEALACRPERVAFVGDSVPLDCEGAETAGLRPVLLDRAGHRLTRFRTIRSLCELHPVHHEPPQSHLEANRRRAP